MSIASKTLAEIRVARLQAERAILTAIREFEQLTETSVDGIAMTRHQYIEERRTEVVDVRLTVRLE